MFLNNSRFQIPDSKLKYKTFSLESGIWNLEFEIK